MAVVTQLCPMSLARWEQLRATGDPGVARRLEEAWFAGRSSVAEEERRPDVALVTTLLAKGPLYDDLDDETSLRMDRLVILAMEQELAATPAAFAPMRDDMQLVVRALRASGKAPRAAELLDHLANGRRFGGAAPPIDVPHYSYLTAAEVAELAPRVAAVLEASRARGLLSRLSGGGLKLGPGQPELLEGIHGVLRDAAGRGDDVLGINRDPATRWDMA